MSDIEQSIKKKIEAIGVPLNEWGIRINFGIKTGCNEAFLINNAKRDEILANCKTDDERRRTTELIRPILRGRDIKRYSYSWDGCWLINTHNGVKDKYPPIEIDDYPAIKQHLDHYWDKIKNRDDKGITPYNLRNCAYMDDFNKPKIVWKRVGSILRFSYDTNNHLALDSTCFATGKCIKYLVAVLNSKFGNYLLKDSPKTGTGDLLISVQAVEPIKIPLPNSETEKVFGELVEEFLKGNSSIEKTINHKVYELYGLNDDEIVFVEKHMGI